MDSTTYNSVMAGYATDITNTYISFRGSGTAGSASTFLTSQGDYARIAGPNVWIEFSCQGGIVIQGQIHYHTVWRDRSHDYGVDLSGPAIDDHSNGITETSAKNSSNMKLYPNPANTSVQLNWDEMIANGSVIVTDMNGRIVFSRENFTGSRLLLDVANFSTGMYMVCARDSKHFYSGKFSKQD
jgi:hypothetical protein